MAEILKNYNIMALPSAIERQNPIPLDSKAVWYDYNALVEYAANGATAYAGQLVAYVDETTNKSTAYVIQNDGSLSEIGANQASNVDGISLQVINNTLSLYGYGKEYYKYNSAQGTEGEEGYIPAGYTLTTGWVAGLEPRVVEKDDKFVLGWYEPNTDTMEGLNTTVGTLSTKVDNLTEDVEDLETLINGGTDSTGEQVIGLVTRVDTLEDTVKNLTSAFIFKGTVATVSELTNISNPQNGWVYKVTDTEAEYAYDGTNWIELGTIYEVDLTDYAKKSDVTTALADYVLEEDFTKLAGRVGTLEDALAADGQIGQLENKVANLETLVGAEATDITEATGLVRKVNSLEEMVGTPATETEVATGLYKVIGDLTYVAKIKVGENTLEPDGNHQIELPIFSGSSVGLIPTPNLENNVENYYLNATGAWSVPMDIRIGNLTYNKIQYTTVEEYIEAYVEDHGLVWEPI